MPGSPGPPGPPAPERDAIGLPVCIIVSKSPWNSEVEKNRPVLLTTVWHRPGLGGALAGSLVRSQRCRLRPKLPECSPGLGSPDGARGWLRVGAGDWPGARRGCRHLPNAAASGSSHCLNDSGFPPRERSWSLASGTTGPFCPSQMAEAITRLLGFAERRRRRPHILVGCRKVSESRLKALTLV